MLQAIRDKATGWLAWLIVIILIIPFAFWGLDQYLGNSGDVVVAEVNGTEITRSQLNAEFDRLTRRAPIDDPALVARLKRQVLDSMIRSEAVAQALKDAGFRYPATLIERQIRTAPDFKTNGKFDPAVYRRFLGQLGINHEQFIARQQQQMVRRQLRTMISATEFVTPGELRELVRLQNRKVDLSYVLIPFERFSSWVKISDDAIRRYYDKHKQSFVLPEAVRLQYIRLDMAELARQVLVDTAELKKLYEKNKRLYRRDPSYRLSHIMIRLPRKAKPAEVQAAMKKARAILARLRAGESFEKLAKKESQDPGSAVRGGRLGVVSKGSFGKAFDKAVEGLQPGGISEPVRTDYGLHIIRLDGVIPGKQMSFAEARPLLEKEYRLSKADERFYSLTEKLRDMTYDDPNSLEQTAQALDLKVRESGWITRKGAPQGIGRYPAIVRVAFSSDVFAKGDPKRSVNSKLIQVRLGRKAVPDPYFVVRLKAYRKRSILPLAQVRDRIRRLLRNKAMQEKAEVLGRKIISELEAGKSLAAVAVANQLKAVDTGLVRRGDRKHDAGLIDHALRMQRPDKNRPSIGGLKMRDGYAVVVVKRVQDGSMKKLPAIARQFMTMTLSSLISEELVSQVLDQMRQNAKIEINDKAITGK